MRQARTDLTVEDLRTKRRQPRARHDSRAEDSHGAMTAQADVETARGSPPIPNPTRCCEGEPASVDQ